MSEAKEVVFLYAAGRDHIVGVGVGTSAVAIPDSRTLWDLIWEHRDVITEIAHSHPVGPGAFSSTDLETAEGLRIALGKPFYFSVVHPGGTLRRLVFPSGEHGKDQHIPKDKEPWWATCLWSLSEAFQPQPRRGAEEQPS